MSSRNRPRQAVSAHAPASAASSLRRAPPALRGAPGSRGSTAAKAPVSVSLVFAHGDAVPGTGGDGSSASEEALSRQLDRDTAGERMSLRSRRSSAGTIASMRTDYTSSHPLSPPLPEEDEDAAGPSRLPARRPDPTSSASLPHHGSDAITHRPRGRQRQRRRSRTRKETSNLEARAGDQPTEGVEPANTRPVADDGASTPPRRNLNPKTSGAWLRWNSPAPAFPKRDKGKARAARDESPRGGGDDSQATSDISHDNNDDGVRQRASDSVPGPKPPLATQKDAQNSCSITPTASAFSAVTQRQQSSTHSTAPTNVDSSPDSSGESHESAPSTPMLKPSEPKADPATPRGWRSYLWGGGASASGSTTPNKASTQDAPPSPEAAPSKKAEDVEASVKSTEGAPTKTTDAKPPPTAKAELRPSRSVKNDESTKRRVSEDSRATNGSVKAASTSKRVEKSAASAKRSAQQDTSTGSVKDTQSAKRPSSVKTGANAKEDQGTKSTLSALSAPPPAEGGLLPAATIEEGPASASSDDGESDDTPTDATPQPQPQPQGWGAYLASWVYPSAAPAEPEPEPEPESQPELMRRSSIIEPSNPTEDQKPEPSSDTACSECPAPDGEDTSETAPPDTGTVPPPPSLHPKPSTSTSSTSGWLSYLAFRASQKRITGSTITPDDARRSGETPREEVMDFENDPEFPAADTPSGPEKPSSKRDATGHSRQASGQLIKSGAKPATAKADAKGVDRKEGPPSTASNPNLTHKRSQNLELARQGSRTSSVCSVASVPPPSPRAQGNGHQPTKSTSDLPAPPKSTVKQANFVIPTFDITFDRPPRSLLPRHEYSGATGLAYRALGYVYGGQPADPPNEKRGKKEGRDVGANLPRRIGLDGGSPDEGWKDVRRVVVVGVHGWFPAKMLTSVIGEPTGTSTKFANMMGEAVRKFFAEKGVDEQELRLTLIPLEGEGTIEHRVDKLYKQYLSNPAWINDLRRADAILFAAHSQGCIVTTHLISRMIAQGHIRTPLNREAVARCEWAFGPIGIVPNDDSKKGRRLAAQMSGHEGGRQKVAMLAMCGVHLGPFYSISTSSVIQPYLQWFENAAARELFEFQDTSSAVSLAYQKALAMVLENEVRLVLLSSLNDQVVPIYGASFSTASHPLLLRALYVDGASYSASDFMTNLLCFAFMLRNAGMDDQGLVEHLSEATAGSLTGVGHSTPYEELGCYSLAVQYLFHAGPAASPLPPLQVESFCAREPRNDFELPWIMRAIVDSPEAKDLFPNELRVLKESILAWRPQTKALKEIKKRLEPMAGRQRLSPLSQTTTKASATSLSSMAAPEPHHHIPHQPHANTGTGGSTGSKRKPPPKAVMTMVGR